MSPIRMSVAALALMPAMRDSAMVRSGGAMSGGAMARQAADSTKRPCTPPAGTMDHGAMKKPDAVVRPPRG